MKRKFLVKSFEKTDSGLKFTLNVDTDNPQEASQILSKFLSSLYPTTLVKVIYLESVPIEVILKADTVSSIPMLVRDKDKFLRALSDTATESLLNELMREDQTEEFFERSGVEAFRGIRIRASRPRMRQAGEPKRQQTG
jgi:hypothetical protein